MKIFGIEECESERSKSKFYIHIMKEIYGVVCRFQAWPLRNAEMSFTNFTLQPSDVTIEFVINVRRTILEKGGKLFTIEEMNKK